MKRKIIGQGSGFTCTLPINWIRTHNLQAGHELDIEQSDGKLIVSTEKKKKLEKVQLDACAIGSIIERFIPALYRKGCDEIEIIYECGDIFHRIRQVLERELIGYEIVEQGTSSCLVKDVTGTETAVFDTLLRRCFLLLVLNARQCYETLQQDNCNEIVGDKNINKLTHLCQRLIVKDAHTRPREAVFLFHVLKELENLADEYTSISEYHKNGKRLGKKEIALLGRLTECVEMVYKLFYSFTPHEAEKIDGALRDITESTASSKSDAVFVHYSMSIARRLQTMLGDYFCLKL